MIYTGSSITRSLGEILHLKEISGKQHDYDAKKNKLIIYNSIDNVNIRITLPWILPAFKDYNSLISYFEEDNIQELKYLIILIRAGYAALGRCGSSTILEHKLIRKYMVRKKQGKAQITYLNKKGKSRAGSRIRLAQTVEFFEDINRLLNTWINADKPGRLLISCPPRLWGLLFRSKVSPVFDKKDARLYRIPLDIRRPDNEELHRVNGLAKVCKIEFEAEYFPLLAAYLSDQLNIAGNPED